MLNELAKGGGRDLCIFAKMPYLAHQENRPVFWEEILTKNNEDQSCIEEEPMEVVGAAYRKYLRNLRIDFKKGVKAGLKHDKLKYEKDLLLEKID